MKYVKAILFFLLFSCIISSQVFATYDAELDRNNFSSDKVYGTNQITQQPESGTTEDLPDINKEVEGMLDVNEIEQNQQYQSRTYFVDSVIFFTGVMIYIFSTLWVTIMVIDKILPFLTSPFISRLTRGKIDNYNIPTHSIIFRFLIMVVVGTLFVTGYAKVWLSMFFGWLLSR